MLISKYSNSPYNTFKEFVWDPTEPVATRPLVFRYAPNSLNLFYAFDGNKNVSDVFYRMTSNGIGAHYDYAPFGATTRTHRDASASFDIVALNPFRFSSEYYDSELDLVYYNYRHYSPSLGRFLSRDPIEEQGGLNLYAFVGNVPTSLIDSLGENTVADWILDKGRYFLWGACCNGEEYDTRTHCCLDSKGKKQLFGSRGCRISKREKIATRVVRKDLYGRMGFDWVLKHSWITYPEGSAGFYPAGGKTTALYSGEVIIPEPQEEDFGAIADSEPVVLDSCDYDIEKFERCIQAEAVKAQINPDIYFVLTNNCQQWRGALISICMGIAKR